jgi:hypothetical protein
MPLTGRGKKTLTDFQKRYGTARGKNFFYASIESGRLKNMEVKQTPKKKVSKV